MKKLNFLVSCLSLTLLLTGLVYAEPLNMNDYDVVGDRYHLAFQDDDYTYYFDTSTIKTKPDGMGNTYIDVWLKCYMSDKSKGKYIQKLGSGYENLSYVLIHTNFKTDLFRNLKIINYDDKGDIINSEDDSSAGWDDIIPDSYYEAVKDEIFKYVNNETQNKQSN